MPQAEFDAFDQLARRRGVKRSTLARQVLEDYLAEHLDELPWYWPVPTAYAPRPTAPTTWWGFSPIQTRTGNSSAARGRDATRLPDDLVTLADERSEIDGVTRGETIRRALIEYLTNW